MNPLWNQLAATANITLAEQQHAFFTRYLDLLLAANQTMNLTRITDRAQAELLHIADSLTLLKHLPPTPFSLADIGSGGGVPGIPLAIARPDARVLLVESTKKKAAFLRQAATALGLRNVEVSDARVEDLGHSERRTTFDIVTARAVGVLPWLIEWAMPLLKKGGKLLAQKGERASEEVGLSGRARKMLHAGEPSIEPAPLPGSEGHVVVIVPKQGPTPQEFPRHPTTTRGKHL